MPASDSARAIEALRSALGADWAPPDGADASGIPLSAPTYGAAEVLEVLDSLLSGRVTAGDKVRRFEEAWAAYVGRKHALMVNSGSSANLLVLSALASPWVERPLLPGDEVITGPVTWLTTVAPIVQVGCRPVFVDVEERTFNLDPELVEAAVTERTRAIMPVHVLGNPARMDALLDIARRNDLLVIEDCCEAHGAESEGRRAGSLGVAGTFSFYFSHHINTIEGGMVVTDDDRLADVLLSMRAHGWRRGVRAPWLAADREPEFDQDWEFIASGYNFRPMEVQAAFGLHQLPKLEGFVEHRRETARWWTDALRPHEDVLALPEERAGTRHAWFGYPLVVRDGAPFARRDLVRFLGERGIATRPIISGNMLAHPVARTWDARVEGELANASMVHRQGLMVGNHHRIGPAQRALLVEAIRDFLGR